MAYTDLTSGYFVFEGLLPYQYLNLLADNDAYDHLAGATTMLFPQATAPLGWIRQVTVNDAFIRVVDTYVGAAGTNGMSAGLAIAHTHTTASHLHTRLVHSHAFQYTSGSSRALTGTQVGSSGAGTKLHTAGGGSGSTQAYNITLSNNSGNTDGATPATNSALTDTIFKYLDALLCVKGS